jgi:hypothetical protein
MNNFQTKKATIGIALLLIIISCNKEELLERFSLAFTNRMVVNVANIQVINAIDKTVFPDGIKVEIIGTPSTPIYDMKGDDVLKYEKRIINVAVSPGNVPTAAKYLEFSLRISHNSGKYYPVTVPFTILSDVIDDRIIRLLPKDSLPAGVKVHSQTNSIGAGLCQTTAPMEFKTIFTEPRYIETTTVTIPSGTTFYNKAGEELCGNVDGTLISFNSNDSLAIRFFPGGLSYKGASDGAGNDFGSGIFTPHGFFSLYLTVADSRRNDKVVYRFSKSAEVLMDVNGGRARSLDILGVGKDSIPLVDNDKIPIWSSDNGVKWTAETIASIDNTKMRFNINHTGWWVMADPSCKDLYFWFVRKFLSNQSPLVAPNCSICDPYLNVILREGVNSRYYTEISLASNGKMIVADPMMSYKKGDKLYLKGYLGNVDSDVKVRFAVYDKEPWNGGKILFNNLGIAVKACGGKLDLSAVDFPQFASIETDFHLVCGNPDGTTTSLSPTAALYVKEVVNGTELGLWNYIGTIRNGKGITMNKLQCGKNYKFNILSSPPFTTDEIDIYQDSSRVPLHYITIPSDCNTDFSVRFVRADWKLDKRVFIELLGDKHYKMLMNEWRPDSLTCAKYRRR